MPVVAVCVGAGRGTRLLSHTAVPVGPIIPSLTVASGALIVQYNYAPAQAGEVSEPGALALLGVALAGLGFSRRRPRSPAALRC